MTAPGPTFEEQVLASLASIEDALDKLEKKLDKDLKNLEKKLLDVERAAKDKRKPGGVRPYDVNAR